MSYSEEKAVKVLMEIRDPESPRDIVTAGRLADLVFEGGVITAVLKIDPAKSQAYVPIQAAMKTALEALAPIDKARIVMTAHKAAPQLQSAPRSTKPNPHNTRRPDGYQGDSQIGKVIAVSSAKGGVGKSTVAVNLAAALLKLGHKVGILDADIHGPSQPRLLDLNGQRAKTVDAEGRTLIKPLEAHGLKAMSIGFLTDDDGPVVWRGPMVQGAINRMLWDTHWEKLDYLIIDMPPGTGDAQLGLAQDIKPAAAIIVTTPQDLALADARKGAAMFGKVHIPLAGLIENMNQFVCGDCGKVHNIFGLPSGQSEAESLNIPYLGAAPLSLAVRESADKGQPIALGENAEAELFSELAQSLIKAL